MKKIQFDLTEKGYNPGDIVDLKVNLPNRSKGKYMVNKLGDLVKISDNTDEKDDKKLKKLKKKLGIE